MIVAKFGGTSHSDAEQFRKVRNILNSGTGRRYIVVSAPGKRFEQDQKITDLLIDVQHKARNGEPFLESFSLKRNRFVSIAEDLDMPGCLDKEPDEIAGAISS